MFVRTASRTLPRCPAACRLLPCRATALTSSSAGSARGFSVAPLAATHAAAVQRRWCSTWSSSASSTSTAPLTGSAASPPPATTAEASSAAADDQLPASVAEQLKVLSPEDQQRILAALSAPEKEKSSVMGGAGIGPADGDMVAAFTCGPCDYRMVKRFSKHAYTKGIVIVECPKCRARHLLADNLGWMEDSATTIEDILKAKGEKFVRIGGTRSEYQVVTDPAETTDERDVAEKSAPASLS